MNKWEDNEIQFARLLSELYATQNIDYGLLKESMDLEKFEIIELFERAEKKFQKIKDSVANNKNIK